MKSKSLLTQTSPGALRKVLLLSGFLSSLIYIGADIIASVQWTEYSYASRSVSELMAIEAPTRPFLLLFFSIYNLLIIAFSAGILLTPKPKPSAVIVGVIFLAYGIIGFIGLYFFPMHLPGVEQTITQTDTMHLVVTGITVLLIMFSVGFGSTVDGKWFRIYSLITIPVLILFGILAGVDGAKIPQQISTPWLGIKERINIYGYLIWVAIFSAVMLSRRYQIPSSSQN